MVEKIRIEWWIGEIIGISKRQTSLVHSCGDVFSIALNCYVSTFVNSFQHFKKKKLKSQIINVSYKFLSEIICYIFIPYLNCHIFLKSHYTV